MRCIKKMPDDVCGVKIGRVCFAADQYNRFDILCQYFSYFIFQRHKTLVVIASLCSVSTEIKDFARRELDSRRVNLLDSGRLKPPYTNRGVGTHLNPDIGCLVFGGFSW